MIVHKKELKIVSVNIKEANLQAITQTIAYMEKKMNAMNTF